MQEQKIVYEIPWLINLIQMECGRTCVVRTDLLEARVIEAIGKYLLEGEHRKRNKRFLRRLVFEKVITWSKLYKREEVVYFSDMALDDEEGNKEEFEPEDVLANIEGMLELEEKQKEMVTLLAQNDHRRKLILTAWTKGFTNNLELSGILADTLGGKSESHRKFIQRFENEVAELSAQAI